MISNDRKKLVFYFAYGSNMNPSRMRERGVTFYSRQHLALLGYSLKFNKTVSIPKAGAANIVPDTEGLVEGVLYQITLKGIYNLDRYEHYPNEYDRVSLKVTTDENVEREIITYVAHPHKTNESLKPRQEYLNHLLEAKDLLSEEYYNYLKVFDTLD